MDMIEKNTLSLYLAELARTFFNNGLSFSLFQNNVSPTQYMQASDFSLCDYDGFAKLPATFGNVYVDGAGELVMTGGGIFTSTPGAGTTNTIYGLLVESTAGAPLLAGNLLVPTFMGLLGQAVNFVVEFRNGQVSFIVLP